MTIVQKRTNLYTEIEPYDFGYLKVSDIHTVYYEQSGKQDGNPVLFLHGGPGMGCNLPKERCWFDSAYYRIVLFDQRGAGKSIPSAEIYENTTWDLVSDIEKLREHLGIKTWVLFGCSWGSTLALTYAITHPEKVKAIVIQGIFLCTRREIEWFYQDGCNMIWPDLFEDFSSVIPENERSEMVKAFYKLLTSSDQNTCLKAARHWSKFELATLRPQVDPDYLKSADNEDLCLKLARIECHYFINGAFFESDSWILDNIEKIQHIPSTLINGRFDVLTPMEAAWKLHKALPKSELVIAPFDGHSDKDQDIRSALLEATEKYKYL